MDVKNIPTIVLSVVVSLIVVSTILIPIVSVAIEDNSTVYNNNISNDPTVLLDQEMTDSYVIEYTPGNNYITIDEKQLKISAYGGNVLWTNKGYILVSTDTSLTNYHYGYLASESGVTSGVSTTTKITVNVVGDDVTIYYDGTDATYSFTNCDWIAYPSENGTHKVTSSTRTSPIYINSVNDVFGTFWINTSSYGLVSFIGTDGTRANGESVSMVINAETDEDYYDLLVLANGASVYLDPEVLTNSGGSNIAPYFYLVPYEVDAETASGHIVNTILAIIPIFVLIGLVIGIVSYFRRT